MKPTMELRRFFYITHYEWFTKWEPQGITTIQQKWIDDNGNEHWVELPLVSEEAPDCPYYG